MFFVSKRLDARGALWRKWDLHFHTPSSFDYKDKSVTNQDIVDGLVKNEISVVAITDHHRIDVERFNALSQLTEEITFLPGIELRSELGGKDSIHYIGLFPEYSNVEELWTCVQGRLGLTRSKIDSITDDHIYIKYEIGCKVIHDLGGIVSVHAGKKSNSFESIGNSPAFKGQAKEDILKEHFDILEVSRPDDRKAYWDIVFPKIQCNLPIIVGSDNHNIREYDTKADCWIRGDASFATLMLLSCEPIDRIYLGNTPPQIERVTKNRTRFIRSVKINKTEKSKLSEKWFDSTIALNYGLVAIIGNKGSGKSALADIIALLGDTAASDSFSFLNDGKFCNPHNNKSKHFIGTIEWESDGKHEKLLSDKINATVESVKYLPQSYIETICNELEGSDDGKFSKELSSVIFSHVDSSERLDCSTFDELLKYKTSEKEKAIGIKRQELIASINMLEEVERCSLPSNMRALEEKHDEIRREIKSHDATKPEVVEKPSVQISKEGSKNEIETKIEELNNQKNAIALKIEQTKSELSKANRQIVAADRLCTRLDSLESEFKMFNEGSVQDCADLGISIENVAKLTIDRTSIKSVKDTAEESRNDHAKSLNAAIEGTIANQLNQISKTIQDENKKLTEPARKYQEYLLKYKEWEKKQLELVGSPEKQGSLKFYENQIAYAKKAADTIPGVLEKVIRKTLDVYDSIIDLSEVYRELYAPVQKFISDHPLAKHEFQMSFETKIIEKGFADEFLTFVAQNRIGSFSGSVEGNERVRLIISEADFSSRENVGSFIRAIWEALHYDLRQEGKPPTIIEEQLKKGKSISDLYNYIFSLSYLRPYFTLRWAGKDIRQLSPGERGTLLLVFYLLIDRSSTPLVIDQPEENLDNQTVYNILVPSIKEAKNRRQLIIVTHNPNLAVVCDADQIICASIDKEDASAISYKHGAIENPEINSLLLDILEGTRPAFDNRESKYA